jgi:hypothetical protein
MLGNSNEENFSEYGVITNHFSDNIIQEIVHDNQHPSLVYVMDSAKFSEKGSDAFKIHALMVAPLMKELKGFGLFYLFDCNHPDALRHKKSLEHVVYNNFMVRACQDSNKERIPTINLFHNQELRRSPFTGQIFKKQYSAFNTV